jgi:hypothetical protein
MKNFTKLVILTLIMASLVSGKKKVEEKKKDLVMAAITSGVWYVEKYLEGTTDISGDFVGYIFKFNTDGTVTGDKAGDISNGTWSGDAVNYSITSNFTGANVPVTKLNGIWKITDSYWDYVEAEKNTSSGKDILHLRKKP